MDQNSIIVFAIVLVVLIGIPVVLSRKTGKNPMEMLFGKQGTKGFFGKQKKESQESQPRVKKQTNSNRNDFLDLISKLTTYARKNHFRLIIPGTLSCDGTVAVLTALIMTRSKVVGINCFGFGGRVVGKTGEEDWEQIMNGVRTTFPSPIVKNRKQEEIVRKVLEETGFADTEVEIVGVFTSPNVWLSDAAGSNCYTKDNAMKYLKSESFLADRGLDPQKIEAALEPRIVRAKDQKDAKNEEKQDEEKQEEENP